MHQHLFPLQDAPRTPKNSPRLKAVESSDLEAKKIIFLAPICGRVDILALRLKQGSADRSAVALPKRMEPKKGTDSVCYRPKPPQECPHLGSDAESGRSDWEGRQTEPVVGTSADHHRGIVEGLQHGPTIRTASVFALEHPGPDLHNDA